MVSGESAVAGGVAEVGEGMEMDDLAFVAAYESAVVL
jgi:hypothetical protein